MRPHELAAALLLGLTAVAPAAAQYKWVGPGGEVNYSDRPPPAGATAIPMGTPIPAARRDDTGLPAALREPASRYPVVLYTSSDCTPCQQARAHLSKRGVPFSERTVTTPADAEAFQRAGFRELSVPALGVGGERSVGYEAASWDRLLDAAGYPKSSMLPPSYRPPAAAALALPAESRGASRAESSGTGLEPGTDAQARAAPGARPRVPRPDPRRELEPPPPGPGSFRF